MAAYCLVYGVIHFTSPAGWLPVHRDQLQAQRSVTSMGKLLPFYLLLWPSHMEHSSFRPPRHYWHRYIQKTTQQCTLWSCLPLTTAGAPGRVVYGALQISRWLIDWVSSALNTATQHSGVFSFMSRYHNPPTWRRAKSACDAVDWYM